MSALRTRLQAQAPSERIARLSEQLNHVQIRLRASMQATLQQRRHRLDTAMSTLNAVSPLATLERGYAIITRHGDGVLVQRSEQVNTGDTITARLAHGELDCRVERRS